MSVSKYSLSFIFSIALACQVACRLTGNENGAQAPKKGSICRCFYDVPLSLLNRRPFLLQVNPGAKNIVKERDDTSFHQYD